MSPAALPLSEKHVALYKILLDGTELERGISRNVSTIKVVDSLQLPDVCILEVGFLKDEFERMNPFDIGTELEIRLGAREEQTTSTLFKGEIVTMEPEFGSGGVHIHVRAYDRAHHLHRKRKVRCFQNQTAADIVTKILKEAGLKAHCDASGGPFEFMQQDNETDWDFIWRLASRIGFEFVVEGDTGYFRRPTADNPVELEYGDRLLSFRARLTAVQQVEEVTVRSFDPLSKRIIESRRSTPNQIARIGIPRDDVRSRFSGGSVHVATEPVHDQRQADALAQSLLDKLANGYIGAEGTADGDPTIRAGCKVRISGVGTKFSGVYRVQTSTHVLSGGSMYVTEFHNSPSHTITGNVNGNRPARTRIGDQLLVGLVTNNKDPKKIGRVRVKFPVLGDDHEGAWARVLVPNAGAERGLMMYPQPGDEVLVAFEHGDTTRPMVLGSLFNGVDKPGAELAAEDGSFGLRSDKNLIQRAKGDITISAGGNLTVEISGSEEEKVDGNRTTKVAGNDETTISGSGTIKATGALTIKGGPKVTIESTGTMAIKATQIDMEGSAMVNIKGGMINLG